MRNLVVAGSALVASGLVALGATACSSDDAGDPGFGYETGAEMLPGENCMRCHQPGKGDPAPEWSAGGTLYAGLDSDEGVEGAKVTLTDTNGKTETVTTNRVGNFHFPKGLERPFKVSIEFEGKTIEMPGEAPAGNCNTCHQHPGPVGDAPGRMFPEKFRGDWVPMDAGAGDGGMTDAGAGGSGSGGSGSGGSDAG